MVWYSIVYLPLNTRTRVAQVLPPIQLVAVFPILGTAQGIMIIVIIILIVNSNNHSINSNNNNNDILSGGLEQRNFSLLTYVNTINREIESYETRTTHSNMISMIRVYIYIYI